MNTITSNTQAQALYSEAADDILAVLDDFNFQTDTRFNPADLKAQIINAIRSKVEGNTNYSKEIGPQ
jgi:hypothetical protein